MRNPRRGSVLVHVLVTGVIVCVIAAGLARMLLLRYAAVQRVQEGTAGRKSAEGGLNRLLGVWNRTNIVCSNIAGGGYTCSPASVSSPGTCNCTCTGGAGDPTVVVSGGGAPPCTVTATSP